MILIYKGSLVEISGTSKVDRQITNTKAKIEKQRHGSRRHAAVNLLIYTLSKTKNYLCICQ